MMVLCGHSMAVLFGHSMAFWFGHCMMVLFGCCMVWTCFYDIVYWMMVVFGHRITILFGSCNILTLYDGYDLVMTLAVFIVLFYVTLRLPIICTTDLYILQLSIIVFYMWSFYFRHFTFPFFQKMRGIPQKMLWDLQWPCQRSQISYSKAGLLEIRRTVGDGSLHCDCQEELIEVSLGDQVTERAAPET